MLARAQRIAKKDFPALLKEPHGKFFCSTHSLLARRARSFAFAPIFPRKLKLGSVKQHYFRRVAYHAVHDICRTHPDIAQAQLQILMIAQKPLLDLSYQDLVTAFTDSFHALIRLPSVSSSQESRSE